MNQSQSNHFFIKALSEISQIECPSEQGKGVNNLYIEVINKNYQIIHNFISKINELFLKNEEYDNNFLSINDKIGKIIHQNQDFRYEYRATYLELQRKTNDLQADFAGIKQVLKMPNKEFSFNGYLDSQFFKEKSNFLTGKRKSGRSRTRRRMNTNQTSNLFQEDKTQNKQIEHQKKSEKRYEKKQKQQLFKEEKSDKNRTSIADSVDEFESKFGLSERKESQLEVLQKIKDSMQERIEKLEEFNKKHHDQIKFFSKNYKDFEAKFKGFQFNEDLFQKLTKRLNVIENEANDLFKQENCITEDNLQAKVLQNMQNLINQRQNCYKNKLQQSMEIFQKMMKEDELKYQCIFSNKKQTNDTFDQIKNTLHTLQNQITLQKSRLVQTKNINIKNLKFGEKQEINDKNLETIFRRTFNNFISLDSSIIEEKTNHSRMNSFSRATMGLKKRTQHQKSLISLKNQEFMKSLENLEFTELLTNLQSNNDNHLQGNNDNADEMRQTSTDKFEKHWKQNVEHVLGLSHSKNKKRKQMKLK